LNGSGVTDLVRTISSTSFTWPATFGRKDHSPPYNIFYASLKGLHPNVTFPQDSQMGIFVPKLWKLIFFQIDFFFENARAISYSPLPLNRSFQRCKTCPVKPHLTFDFKGFVVGNQILNLIIAPSFDHNSC
jgi:hypothetical protein